MKSENLKLTSNKKEIPETEIEMCKYYSVKLRSFFFEILLYTGKISSKFHDELIIKLKITVLAIIFRVQTAMYVK